MMGNNEDPMSQAIRLEGKTVSRADVIVIGLILIISGSVAIHRIDPRENMWVTWANKTGQPAFCLSLASATEPFETCLLGVPG